MEKVTLVTTTHDRPECFALLERWIALQSEFHSQWLVVNDSEHPEAYSYTLGQEVIQRDPSGDKLPSICCNWLAALPHIKGDVVVNLDDDDYYHPEFLATMLEGLRRGELAGVTRDVYYHVPGRRVLYLQNTFHASLACTGFRKSLIPWMEHCCQYHGTVWIDQHLWHDPPRNNVVTLQQPVYGRYLHVGMKGMPGAAGLGLGHGSAYAGWVADDDFSLLRSLVGHFAADFYESISTAQENAPCAVLT